MNLLKCRNNDQTCDPSAIIPLTLLWKNRKGFQITCLEFRSGESFFTATGFDRQPLLPGLHNPAAPAAPSTSKDNQHEFAHPGILPHRRPLPGILHARQQPASSHGGGAAGCPTGEHAGCTAIGHPASFGFRGWKNFAVRRSGDKLLRGTRPRSGGNAGDSAWDLQGLCSHPISRWRQHEAGISSQSQPFHASGRYS